MKAVVLAGGVGARQAPYTTLLPKPLMPVGDMPVLEVLLRQLKGAGVGEVILAVGHLASLFEAYFRDGKSLGMQISYSKEQHPLGTAGPLSLIEGLQEPFFVLNGDVLTTLDFTSLVRVHQAQAALATIATHERKVPIDFGVIQFNGGRKICGYVEKPSYTCMVSMGVYVFEPGVLAYIPHGEYLDFPNLVLRLIDAGEKVVGFPYDGYWQDLGRPDDYQEAARDFACMQAQFLPGA